MSDQKQQKTHIYVKSATLITLLSMWVIYRNLETNPNSLEQERMKNNKCFYDIIVEYYYNGFIEYLSQHLFLRDCLLITASSLLDVLFITLFILFVYHSRSWQVYLNFILFYATRGIFQEWFLFEYVPIYLFDHPGFPSLVVPFLRAADFFYSGHAGSAFICAISF